MRISRFTTLWMTFWLGTFVWTLLSSTAVCETLLEMLLRERISLGAGAG